MTFEFKTQKSILDNIVCYEKINTEILQKLINSNPINPSIIINKKKIYRSNKSLCFMLLSDL